jgi:thioredoxin
MAQDVTNATFESEVLQSGEPVLVDFWAEWCGPCHAVSPVLERISEEKNLKLVKVNIDENQDLAIRYGIQSIPNMILFENGQPKANAVGAMPKGMLERQLGRGGWAGGEETSPPPAALEKAEERGVLGEELLDLGDADARPVLEPALLEVVRDAMEPALGHAGMIDSRADGCHGPIGSTSRPAGPRAQSRSCRARPQPPTS